jgi:hypothetical protein
MTLWIILSTVLRLVLWKSHHLYLIVYRSGKVNIPILTHAWHLLYCTISKWVIFITDKTTILKWKRCACSKKFPIDSESLHGQWLLYALLVVSTYLWMINPRHHIFPSIQLHWTISGQCNTTVHSAELFECLQLFLSWRASQLNAWCHEGNIASTRRWLEQIKETNVIAWMLVYRSE